MDEVFNSCLIGLNNVGRGFWDYAAGIFVQSGLLIILLLIIDFLLRKRVRAVFRYCVWMLVFVKLVLPPTLCLPTGIGYWCGDYLSTDSRILQHASNIVQIEAAETLTPEDSVLSIGTPQVQPSRVIPETIAPVMPAVSSLPPLTWQAFLFLLWLMGVLVISVLLIQRMSFVKGLVAQSEPAKNRLLDVLNECRRQVGIRRNIELRLSNNISGPAVCGLFKPIILVPTALLEKLPQDKLRAVLIHELIHIRRGDLWVNSMQTFLQIIYFYNPFVWLANAVVRRIREQAVDEMVLVSLGAGAKYYSNTLIDIAEMAFFRASLSLRFIGVVESKKALTARIKHILNRPMPKKAKLGIIGLVVVIIIGAVLLPMASSMSGSPELVIKGVVKDARTNEPIAGARVFDDKYGPEPVWEQIHPDQRCQWGAITNEAGEYSFLTWPEHHSIKVEAPGYKSQRRSLYKGHFVINTKDQEIFDFTLEPENVSDSSEFKATLPNGVTVELIGICVHPSEGKKWWQPDGIMIEDNFRPYAFKELRSLRLPSNQQENKILELAVKITDSSNRNIGIICSGEKRTFVNCSNNVWGGTVEVGKEPRVQDFKIGVALGAWETLASSESKFGRRRRKTPDIVFTEAYNTPKGYAVVIVTHKKDIQKENWQVAAIDKEGKTHKADLYQTQGIREFEQNMFHFKGLRSDQIRRFEFQIRPYQWIEFKNVSLQPGIKTDVQVEGESRISRLLAGLQNEKYVHIREPIIQMVQEIGDKEPILFLTQQLESENRRRRCDAALALELLGDRRGVPAIINELNDTSYRPTTRIRSDGREHQEGQIRQDHYYAALLLGILGDERAVPALIEATWDESIAYQAAISLGQIGDKRAIPALHHMVQKYAQKPFLRLWAGYSLGTLDTPEGVRIVVDTLNNRQQHWTIRRHAIEALSKLGDKRAVPHLIAALKDEHPNIRVSAARALGAIGDASALRALEEALKDNTETKVNAPTTVSKAAAEAIAQIKAGGRQKSAVQVEVEQTEEKEQAADSVNYAWQRTDCYVLPNPEEFFPDDPQGGKQLDALFDSVDKDRRTDGEILSTVRQGFRRTSKHRTLILSWVGNKYIWNKQPQNPEAVEIMYHAVPMERHYAIYFGLSVLQPKTPNVLRTLAEVCMQGEDVGRITWGTRSQRDELVSYIEPYLEHENQEKREMAFILLKHFGGEIDFEKWKREKFLEQKKIEFADRLPEFRDKLLTGNSKTRREVLTLIQRNGIGSLLDDSFLDSMNACAEDKDPEVRSRVASIAGSRWVWSGEENDGAIQLMLKLSYDEDRDTRYKAVYYGLSTVRNKSQAVIRRLVELALADHENNLYGRIVWGLSGPMRADKELSERILAEQLDEAKSELHHRAALYLLYRDVLKEEPPRDWGLEDVKEHYPEDVFMVYFSAEESFQSKSEDEVWAEFKKNLPDSIDMQRLPNINPRKQNIVFFKIRGEKASDAVKKIIEKNPNLRLGQVAPFPIQMQLFFEEMQTQIELEKR